MLLKIDHYTSYHYESDVFLEPHHFYFRPSPCGHVQLMDFDIQVTPNPSGSSLRLDAENNLFHQYWFVGQTNILEVAVSMRIEVTPYNPFNYLINPLSINNENEVLPIYLKKLNNLNPDMESFVSEIQKYTNNDIGTFISMLCGEINLNWIHQHSYLEKLKSPNECFQTKTGSCRDLSWMMIQMLRYANVAARFVSGYAYNIELQEDNELHAWVEAWIPGAGWIGVDPSSGLITTEHYIPIACSYHPKNTLPIQGTYRGNAKSKLTTQVKITQLDE